MSFMSPLTCCYWFFAKFWLRGRNIDYPLFWVKLNDLHKAQYPCAEIVILDLMRFKKFGEDAYYRYCKPL